MIKNIILATAAAFALSACAAPASNSPANTANTSNANVNAAKSMAAAPTKDALMALEKSAYEAWKTKDAKFWDPFLTANFVGFGSGGKLDRAAAIKSYSGGDCDIKSINLSDDQMTLLGNDAAVLTHKVSVDGTCGGQKVPANSWVGGVYVREGDKWKGAFHAESPITDPNAKPVAPSSNTKAASTAPAGEAKSDPATDAMFVLEKKAWEDWKTKNAAGLDAWAGKDMVSFTSNGRQDRAGALKTWMADGCEIKSVSLTDPASISFGSDFALLTFKSSVDGKCGGAAVTPEYGASVYGKEAGAWKAVFTMGSPIM
ncbi:MAG: nuclear transport factor 2 family protein [Pyrinomonadaceae bacterium]